MIKTAKIWVPLGIALTIVFGFSWVALQQNLRMAANDPQIQMSEDMAAKVSVGEKIYYLGKPSDDVDISKSLAPYFVIYSQSGEVLGGTGILDGKTPKMPEGVLDFAKTHGQNRVTWQPKPGVRSAIVVTPFLGKDQGFVMVGRSLREVEKREGQLTTLAALGYVSSLAATLFACVVLVNVKEKK